MIRPARIPLSLVKAPEHEPLRRLLERSSIEFRIWSGERCAWWRPRAAGYTTDPGEAGRWSFADAFDGAGHCGAEKEIAFELVEEDEAPLRADKPGLRGATILTRSGRYFDFLDPQPDQITIEDIAHALSQTCRFAAHTPRFYSVAQHCVLVSRIVPAEHAFAGLMHDAAEAYVGDIPSPLKQLLPDFKAIEARVEAAIAAKFGLELPWPSAVKNADLVALSTEQRDVRKNSDSWGLEQWPPLATRITPVSPETAKATFLAVFHELASQREKAA